MKKKRKFKMFLVLMMILTILFSGGCEKGDTSGGEKDSADDNNEILGGPLTSFESVDIEDNAVDEKIFAEADVNLIFVWQSG